MIVGDDRTLPAEDFLQAQTIGKACRHSIQLNRRLNGITPGDDNDLFHLGVTQKSQGILRCQQFLETARDQSR